MERLSIGTKPLPQLDVGDHVIVQNQIGNYPSRWDITGMVVEKKPFDQYIVRVDGSGRMTLRNRKFLRKISPFMNTKASKPNYAVVDPTVPTDKAQGNDSRPGNDPPLQVDNDISREVSLPENPGGTEIDLVPDLEEHGPTLRRSTRECRAPDRLNIHSFHGQSYDETSTNSVASNLTSWWTGGGGGITEIS